MTASTFFTIIVLLLAVLVAVVAYNMYKKNQYRKKIRSQFGHADQDALLGSSTQSVRDGKSFETPMQPARSAESLVQPETPPPAPRPAPPAAAEPPSRPAAPAAPQPAPSVDDTPLFRHTGEPQTPPAPQAAVPQPAEASFTFTSDELSRAPAAQPEPAATPTIGHSRLNFELIEETTPPVPVRQPEKPSDGRRLLVDLDDLYRSELLWFDRRFDFMAYVSLYEPKELHALPRLSASHRFQIIGCTKDGRFQPAEPIPGVSYRAFAIGLQAISRNGLIGEDELQHFCNQVQLFADKMDGRTLHEDIRAFLNSARPLDELCARVDQTIAIHLVSRGGSVLGTELRSALEKQGFRLLGDGSFGLTARTGETKYSAVALDGSAFTDALLSSQPYKGFSMLFDITRVSDGENNFSEFMNLAVSLSSQLELDLVDDQIQQLSTDWLKEVRSYVGARQNEMLAVGIEPGSALAKRLFS